jgi:hypothetical protein
VVDQLRRAPEHLNFNPILTNILIFVHFNVWQEYKSGLNHFFSSHPHSVLISSQRGGIELKELPLCTVPKTSCASLATINGMAFTTPDNSKPSSISFNTNSSFN